MQKIVPCLWFDANAEEAINYYTSLIKNSKIEALSHYGKDGPGVEGTVMTVMFQLNGQAFMAINGGPIFTFSPAISFMINCENQAEVDLLWDGLSAGGETMDCGWLKDKYGISWQIVPTILGELMQGSDPKKVANTTRAMLQMKKLDIAALKLAYEQG